MDAKLLLVKAITLLYLNGKLEEGQSDASSVARAVIEQVKPRDKFLNTEFGESDPINELRETLKYMSDKPSGTEFDETDLKQRFRLNVKHNDDLYTALVDGLFTEDVEQERILKMYNSHRGAIRAHINKTKLAETLKHYFIKTTHQSETVDYKTIIEEIKEKLNPYNTIDSGDAGIYAHPSIVNNTSMSNFDEIASVFSSTKDELDSKGVIRTPYHGLNRMCGSHGGIRRGETTVVTALTHNYKTGMVLDMFMGCPLFNKPYMRDPTKKPLNLRISYENTTQQDFKHLYTKLYEYEEKVPVDMRYINVEEAAQFVMDKLNVNGYESQIIHIDPSDFTYPDLFKLIETLEEDGYEIHLLTIDYLNMMSKAGCTNEAIGDNVRDLLRRSRNFCIRRGIALVTPHQFSSEARKLERGEPRNFVKVVTGRGYYDSCSRLEQEIDLELSLHIVEFNGESYLTMQRGKHRGVVTPNSHQYCVYKFEAVGGIPFDVLGDDLSRKSIGADTQADGGAAPWFESVI